MKMMCVKCGKELKCKKNEVIVEELVDIDRSYRILEADLWKCPKCGIEIITGFGLEPIAGHWQKDYRKILAREKERVKVYQLQS